MGQALARPDIRTLDRGHWLRHVACSRNRQAEIFAMIRSRRRAIRKPSFLREHSLSITAAGLLLLWIGLYCAADPSTHLGSFFGNAIADWSGVMVMVFATKYLYETGSAESRRPPRTFLGPFWQRLRDHSLTIFLVVTGIAWIALYAAMDSESRWGQVVGNIVSEWTQLLGLVVLTKRLVERHSKESSRSR
jgi:hypothetical protein